MIKDLFYFIEIADEYAIPILNSELNDFHNYLF